MRSAVTSLKWLLLSRRELSLIIQMLMSRAIIFLLRLSCFSAIIIFPSLSCSFHPSASFLPPPLLLFCKCVPRLGLLRIGPLRSIHSTILSTWPSTFQNSTVSYHYITLQLNWATLSLRSQFSTVYFNCSEHASVWIWERMVVLLILFSH